MNRLYLVRHGENPANIAKQFSCRRVDLTLTEKGVLQAEQTAAFFATRPVDAIYASPLKRAIQTAQIIARPKRLPVIVMENFREIDVGDLELTPPTAAAWEFHDRIFLSWLSGRPDMQFPGGEDYHHLWVRMRSGVEQITRGRDGQSIIVVGHGGIFTATLRDLCSEVDMPDILLRQTGNCSITEVELDRQNGSVRGRLVEWASCAHLSGEAANQVSGLPDEGTFLAGPASTP